ncbi:MAG: aromatic acid exporter family protein [Enterococcus aquimarinus]|nr:aromatic acid exporter family protein [Enterococcus aquimarinus]
MKFGMRTMKTVLACFLSMVIAQQVGLLYAPAAGIIAILSVGNTKKKSLDTGIARLVSLGIATVLAFFAFQLLGYGALGFSLYLIFFIPITVKYDLTDGIVVTSVLVTHYMLEQSFTLSLILNEFLLMGLGVGFALMLNLYMPNLESKINEEQEKIEEGFREIFLSMAASLNQKEASGLLSFCDNLLERINQGRKHAQHYDENQLLSNNWYYEEYFAMRRSQVKLIKEMIFLIGQIQVEEVLVEDLRILLTNTGMTLSEKNDGQSILKQIDLVSESYRLKPLPRDRQEFENRARLFQYLQTFKNFIELKAAFYSEQKDESRKSVERIY